MSQQAYLHKLFVRKHLIAVLRSSPTALVAFRHLPLRVWRAWTPDQEDCLADIPDAMTALGLQELLGGVPAQLAACWACLLLPVRRMAPEAQALWRDPRERPHMILVAAEYRSLYGVAPTPALLTQLVLRNRQANQQEAMRAPVATPGAPHRSRGRRGRGACGAGNGRPCRAAHAVVRVHRQLRFQVSSAAWQRLELP